MQEKYVFFVLNFLVIFLDLYAYFLFVFVLFDAVVVLLLLVDGKFA